MSQAHRAGSRIAFFGGSFDPPHRGHLTVARAARVALGLDTVLFAPVGTQPLKTHGATAGFEDRVAMTRLAIAGEPGFDLSLADAPRPSGEPNFTLETLKRLRAAVGPDCTLFCLMGADSFFNLKSWHRAAEIPFLAPFIVASRPGQRLGESISILQAALPPELTLEPAAHLLPQPKKAAPGATDSAPAESSLTVRAFSLMNAAGDRAPFYLLPGLNVEISASAIREAIRKHKSSGPLAGTAISDPLPAVVREYIAKHNLYC
jgi:nicotinate-nucleotide adenylyltransferase